MLTNHTDSLTKSFIFCIELSKISVLVSRGANLYLGTPYVVPRIKGHFTMTFRL